MDGVSEEKFAEIRERQSSLCGALAGGCCERECAAWTKQRMVVLIVIVGWRLLPIKWYDTEGSDRNGEKYV